MSELSQYAILFGLSVGVFGLVLSLYGLARAIGRARAEPGKDVPATAGTLSRDPVWVRYHARYAGYALLFLAFDMEMAFMYPCLLYTSPSPRDQRGSRMPSSA